MPFDYPIKEVWGITINPNVKSKKHYPWYVCIWNWIKSLFKKQSINSDGVNEKMIVGRYSNGLETNLNRNYY